LWLDILRVGAVGIALGLVVGKLVVARPHYLELLRPRLWLPMAKKMSRGDWLKLLAAVLAFAALGLVVVYPIGAALVSLGVETYSPEEYTFERLREFSLPLLLLAVNLLPVFEEWIFRGILLEEIARRGRSRVLGVFLSTLAFAAFHLSNPGTYPAFVLPAFAAGLVYSACYLSSGLPGAIGAHCLYNSIIALWP